jgi:hypothetical protein
VRLCVSVCIFLCAHTLSPGNTNADSRASAVQGCTPCLHCARAACHSSHLKLHMCLKHNTPERNLVLSPTSHAKVLVVVGHYPNCRPVAGLRHAQAFHMEERYPASHPMCTCRSGASLVGEFLRPFINSRPDQSYHKVLLKEVRLNLNRMREQSRNSLAPLIHTDCTWQGMGHSFCLLLSPFQYRQSLAHLTLFVDALAMCWVGPVVLWSVQDLITRRTPICSWGWNHKKADSSAFERRESKNLIGDHNTAAVFYCHCGTTQPITLVLLAGSWRNEWNEWRLGKPKASR